MNCWFCIFFTGVSALFLLDGNAQVKLDSVLIKVSDKEIRISPFVSNTTLIQSNNFNKEPVLSGDTIYLDLCFRILTFTAIDYWDTTMVQNISSDSLTKYYLKIRLFDGDAIASSCDNLQDTFDTIIVKPVSTSLPTSSTRSIRVFPNPAKETIKLEIPDNKTSISVTIINSIGNVIRTYNTEKAEYEISVENLPEGIYYLRVNTPFLNEIKRIIVAN